MTELSADDQSLLEGCLKCIQHFEMTLGKHYSDGLWTRMDRLYHGWTGMRSALRDTTGQARDAVYNDARKEFGHELFIMHAYAIVETVLPALLSNRPQILILPGDQAAERNVQYMKATIDAQQANISIELPLQSTVKSGLQYGIGAGKSYWLRREVQRPRVKPLNDLHPQRALYALSGGKYGSRWTVATDTEPLFDDPTYENIPVRDFGWDAFAANIDNARHAWHRTWRDTAYVKARLADPGGWNNMALTDEDIETGNGSADRYRKSVRGPFEAQNIPIPSQQREVDIHEVLEYHDRARIITILDRKWIVSVASNEVWQGRLPFHIYRPTEVLNQFVGKGEIEPIEDLQIEMNQLRTDRRWAALMALNPVLFVQEGIVDLDKIKVGPGEINAVNGDPHDLIWQLEIKDVPASSVRETAEIAQDIVRTSGISDSFAGGDAGSQATATGVQLQLARASARIQFKTHRAEIELIKPIGRHWVALNQRHILDNHAPVRMPAPPTPDEPERRWTWFKPTPVEMAGEFEIDVDGGSTTPDNIPQLRQDAQILAQTMAGPLGQMLDARQIAIRFLENMGIKNPESLLSQGGQPIPPETLDLIAQHLTEAGMDPQEAQQLVGESLQEVMQAKDQQAQQPDHGQGQPPDQGAPMPQAA